MGRRFVPLLFAAALSGCASFEQSELNQVRARSLAGGRSQARSRPSRRAVDVVELSRRGVPDEWIMRQIEDHDVDSFISRSDVTSLRRAGVRSRVIDALVKASDRFAEDYRYPDAAYFGSYYGDPYLGSYGPYPGYWSGGIGATFVLPSHRHHHHHR